MKSLKYFLGVNVVIASAILFSGFHLTSCTKEVVHDTTTITVHDTICHIDVGMIAHYTFTNGSLLDESGNGNNIIFNNATAVPDRFGIPNNAYLFDGSSSYMRVADTQSLNPEKSISIMAIVKVNDFYMGTCHASEIIGKGYPDNITGYYNLRVRDPYGDCYGIPDLTKEFFVGSYGDDVPQGTAPGAASDTGSVQKQRWYTVVYTYDGRTSKMYVDGVLAGTEEKAHTFTRNNHDVFIGRHEDPSFPYWFNGVIDEIRVYNRALCECEVQQLSQPEQEGTDGQE